MQHQGRRAYSKLLAPDFSLVAASISLRYERAGNIGAFGDTFGRPLATEGTTVIDVDRAIVNPHATAFGGPPVGAGGGAR